ncbi:MAG: hypothetical protein FWD60_09070 [Candidatus Azobacteroides sp.]|nr:hypothetical protein [Candidatus Azobacteroides sp.]
MSNEKKSNGSKGIGLCGFVFLIFLVLKLAEIGVVASWSWWWITAPLWIPFGIGIIFLIVFLIILVIRAISKS